MVVYESVRAHFNAGAKNDASKLHDLFEEFGGIPRWVYESCDNALLAANGQANVGGIKHRPGVLTEVPIVRC